MNLMKILLLGADENSLNLIGSTNAQYDLVGFQTINFRNPKIQKKTLADVTIQHYDLIVFPSSGVSNHQIKSLYESQTILLPPTFLQKVRQQTIIFTFHPSEELETMAHLANTQVFSLKPTTYSVRSQEVLNPKAKVSRKKAIRRVEVLLLEQKDRINRLNHIFNKLHVTHVVAQYQPQSQPRMTTFVTTNQAIRNQLQTESQMIDINYYLSKEQQSELVQQSIIKLYEQRRCQKQPASTYQKTIRGYL